MRPVEVDCCRRDFWIVELCSLMKTLNYASPLVSEDPVGSADLANPAGRFLGRFGGGSSLGLFLYWVCGVPDRP